MDQILHISHILVLLLPAPYLCGATEYYVRPMEPTNTSCPGQPCLTFSQYINDSDHYFKSNTVFRFQSGIHQVNRSVSIRNVHNISMVEIEKDKETKVIFYLPCNQSSTSSTPECRGFVFRFASYITIDGLTVVVHSQSKVPLFGMMFMNITRLSIKHSTMITVNSLWSYSINVIGGKHVNIISLTVTHGGIKLIDTENASINTMTAVSCHCGVYMLSTNNTAVTDVAVRSAYIGMYLHSTIYTRIRSTTLEDISVQNMTITEISSTDIISLWSYTALQIYHSTYLNITTVSTMSSDYGILVYNTHYVTIKYITLRNPRLRGISITLSNFIVIRNTHILGREVFLHNRKRNISHDVKGITTLRTTNLHIFNLNVIHCSLGIFLFQSNAVTVNNMTAANWTEYSIYMMQVTNTTMENIVMRLDISSFQRKEKGIMIEDSSKINISHSVFRYFNTSFSTTTITRQPAVVQLLNSLNISIKNCIFHGNNITALKLVRSHITVFGTLNFTANRAYRGAAMMFIDESSMTLSETGYVICAHNWADDTGGAIYIVTRNSYSISRNNFEFILITENKCFLRVEGNDLQDRLMFINNSAGQGGEVLYKGSLAPWCTEIEKCDTCLHHFQKHSIIKPDTLSTISSNPSRVCFCSEAGMPDCLTVLYPTTYSIYPGQTIDLSLIVVGYNFGTVAGSVFAQFLLSTHLPQLEDGQSIQAVQQHHCNILHYTILSKSEADYLVLTLTAVKRDVTEIEYMSRNFESLIEKYKHGQSHYIQDILEFPIYVSINLRPCPPGFEHYYSKCECKKQLQFLPDVMCNIRDLTIQRRGLVWIGALTDGNGTPVDTVSAQYCPLNYCKIEIVAIVLNQSDTQCNYNHSGTLCGGCQPGLSLALGSAQCLKCSNKYLALLISLTLAGFVLVLFIKILDLTTSKGFINGLIFYANILKPNEHIFLPQTNTNPLTLFIAWLNLDLGIETCFVDGLTAYWKTWLQFVFPFYIWAIAGLIIISARYSTRLAGVMGNNSVPVLATLFLLSYAKLLRTIITIMSYTVVDTPHGQKTVWSADGNIDYLGPEHALLFVAGIVTLLFLWLPYTLLLILGQWLRKINHRYVTHMLMKVKPFLDAHYGPLKDKHYYWFGVLLCMRGIILLISAVVPANNFSVFTLSMSIIAGALISFTSIGPAVYCNVTTSIFEISLFINLALLGLAKFYTNSAGGYQAAATYTLIGVAFIQFLGLILYQIYSFLKPLFSHYRTHHDGDEAAEGIWRYNTSMQLWNIPCRATPYHDAATAL